MSEQTREQIIEEIAERTRATMGADLTTEQAERVEAIVDKKLGEMPARKLAHGGEADNVLAGTKFERAGLTPADVAFGAQLLSMREKKTGERRMSEQTRNIVAALGKRDMGTDQAGSGDEMIADTLYSGDMMADARAESRVASLIRTMPMSGPVQTLPVRAAFPTPILASESQGSGATLYAAQDINSNRVTVTAKKILWRSIWPTELEEDSLFPLVPFIRQEMADSLAFHLDALVLRGDTTDAATGNINSDDADPAATTWFLAWDGIAHLPLVNVTSNAVSAATALTYSKLTNLRSLMYDSTYYLDWGHPNNPADLVFVADPVTGDEIADLDEVVTVQNFGTNATVLTGQVGAIGANPLISSAALGRAEADGKMSNTGSNNTLGRVLAFNRNGFVLGVRRAPTIEMDSEIDTDQMQIVMSARYGFGIHTPTGANTGAEQAALLYNI